MHAIDIDGLTLEAKTDCRSGWRSPPRRLSGPSCPHDEIDDQYEREGDDITDYPQYRILISSSRSVSVYPYGCSDEHCDR